MYILSLVLSGPTEKHESGEGVEFETHPVHWIHFLSDWKKEKSVKFKEMNIL